MTPKSIATTMHRERTDPVPIRRALSNHRRLRHPQKLCIDKVGRSMHRQSASESGIASLPSSHFAIHRRNREKANESPTDAETAPMRRRSGCISPQRESVAINRSWDSTPNHHPSPPRHSSPDGALTATATVASDEGNAHDDAKWGRHTPSLRHCPDLKCFPSPPGSSGEAVQGSHGRSGNLQRWPLVPQTLSGGLFHRNTERNRRSANGTAPGHHSPFPVRRHLSAVAPPRPQMADAAGSVLRKYTIYRIERRWCALNRM